MGTENDRQLRVGEIRRALQRDGDRFTHAELLTHPGCERLIEAATSLLRHPERAVTEPGRDILRRAAEACDLVVVDRGGAVHREVRDDPTPHEIDHERAPAPLYDVT